MEFRPVINSLFRPLFSAVLNNATGTGGASALAPVTANKVLWLKKGVGVTHVANVVSAWADQSGAGNNLVQATESRKPILQGDNTILFDGVDDFMSKAFTLPQPATIYARLKQNTWTGDDCLIGGVAGVSGIFQYVSSPNIVGFAGGFTASNANATISTWRSVCLVLNGASSVLRVDNTADATGNIGTSILGGVSLAAYLSGSAPGNVSFSEVIVYNVAHTAGERDQTIAYLSGLTP